MTKYGARSLHLTFEMLLTKPDLALSLTFLEVDISKYLINVMENYFFGRTVEAR